MILAAQLGGAAGLSLYSFSLGLLGAVNPCGFPLLSVHIVAASKHSGTAPISAAWQGLRRGLAVTLGVVVVFGVLGAIVEEGVHVSLTWVPWAMIPVGVVMFAFGVGAAMGRLPRLRLPRALAAVPSRLGMFGFGVLYAVASLTCSLPIFLAGVAETFTRQGWSTGLGSGLAYALGVGLVLTALSIVGAGSPHLTLRRARAWHRTITVLAGGLVALVGAYLVLYWTVYLVDPLRPPAPVRAIESLQNWIANRLSSSPRDAALILVGVVIVALCAALLPALRGRRSLRRAGSLS
ncbi:MAG: cytochrome c biogenesis protein CcdA [Acidimicrobiales bacterium]